MPRACTIWARGRAVSFVVLYSAKTQLNATSHYTLDIDFTVKYANEWISRHWSLPGHFLHVTPRQDQLARANDVSALAPPFTLTVVQRGLPVLDRRSASLNIVCTTRVRPSVKLSHLFHHLFVMAAQLQNVLFQLKVGRPAPANHRKWLTSCSSRPRIWTDKQRRQERRRQKLSATWKRYTGSLCGCRETGLTLLVGNKEGQQPSRAHTRPKCHPKAAGEAQPYAALIKNRRSCWPRADSHHDEHPLREYAKGRQRHGHCHEIYEP
jgi:hypothetical protein